MVRTASKQSWEPEQSTAHPHRLARWGRHPGDTEAHVAWDEPTVNFNLLGILPPLTRHEVTRHLASDGSAINTTEVADDTEVTVTGLKKGAPVYVTVTATSLLGIVADTSGPSNTVIPAGPPFAPTDVVATRGDSQIEVSWLAPAPRPGSD